jgi:molybdopterin-binding protein
MRESPWHRRPRLGLPRATGAAKGPGQTVGGMYAGQMGDYGVGEAATVLGVSPDTVRRWIDSGDLTATRTQGGRRRVEAAVLADFAKSLHRESDHQNASGSSARNHLPGIVTKVVKDKVMAQVEVQAGPFRLVSLISREAADELSLAPGAMVHAVVKATSVSIEGATP